MLINHDFANVFNAVRKLHLVISIGMIGSYTHKINCVHNSSLHELHVREAHVGGLIGHFGIANGLNLLSHFLMSIKYKQGKENVVIDALFRRYALISTLNVELLGFEYIKRLYVNES